ncbi:MAG TPA: MCP four helix bundle domain-containing protein [Ruminiclostridium sp.]|nr:MCP four helix bundle domain-containing protein [Ruminiclostridium sp.]
MFKLLNNAKIKVKLILLTTVMIIGMLLVGSMGLYHTLNSQKDLSSIYNNNLGFVDSLSDASTQLLAVYADTLRLTASDDTNYKNVVASDIKLREQNFDNNIKKFALVKMDDSDRVAYSSIKDELIEWRKVKDNAIELASAGKNSEAAALLKDTGEPLFQKLESSLTDLKDDNSKQAADVYNKSLASAKGVSLFLIILIISVSVVCIGIGVVIVRSITKPVSKAVALIRKTAAFDLVHDNSYDKLLNRTDEIGIIIKEVSLMRTSLHDTISKLNGISSTLAANSEELTASTDESKKSITQVTTALDEMARGNTNQSEIINKANEHITKIAEHIAEADDATTENEKTAMKSLQTVSEGYNAIVLTSEKMQENIEVSEEVNKSLADLSESIGKVGNITDVINSIATQTNLLALNAAIEAARAGESGKGFAVVAEEIRKLAEESSSAAKEINDIIKDTIANNVVASRNMERARELEAEQSSSVDITRQAFDNIKSSVEAITAKTKKSSQMLATIDMAAKEISSHTQELAALAEESAASSEEISASSQQQLASMEIIADTSSDLSEMALQLDSEIRKFKI